MRSRQRLRRHVGPLPYLALSITAQETRFQMHSEFLTDAAESEKKGGGKKKKKRKVCERSSGKLDFFTFQSSCI